MTVTIEMPQVQDASALFGMHVLGLMPPARKDRTRYLQVLLEAGKKRWNWKISAICGQLEGPYFKRLIGDDGNIFLQPFLIKEQPWESDPSEVERVEALMREAEVAASFPTGRIILASAHSVGRGYNLEVRHVRKYALVRRVLADNTEPFRIIRRLFRFVDEVLEAVKPDAVFAFEWATPLSLTLWFAAQRRNIPCVALRFSKINANHGFWTTDRLMMNRTAIKLANCKRASGASVSEAARSYIRKFREQPQVIKYISNKWSNRTKRGFVRWHLENGKVIMREFINGLRGQDTALREPPFGRVSRYYHSRYLGYSQRKFFTSYEPDQLKKMKYIYFPLHKEAELAQTFQATLWHDQRNTVRVLASLLPSGYRLLVREHRMNVGHRPTRSLQQYSKLPNVTLIDPFDSQFKYLQHASLVVTENGSSGWEGLLLKRPVLLLSHTFYDGTGLGVRVTDPDDLNDALLRALDDPAVPDVERYEHALGCTVDAELETTFPLGAEGAEIALDHLLAVVPPRFHAQDAGCTAVGADLRDERKPGAV